MIVYIRHGHDDEELKYSSHQDDVLLLKQGWELSRVRARRLIRYFGVPHMIRCSPFQRAMDTARAMVDWIEKHYAVVVPIEVDRTLSRFFSKDEQAAPDLNPQTASLEVPIYEQWKDFRRRVSQHTHNMIAMGAYGPDKRIWCISHSIVLLEVAEYHHTKIRDPVEYLDWFDLQKLPCDGCLQQAYAPTPPSSNSSSPSP